MDRSSLLWKLCAGHAVLIVLALSIIGILSGRRIERDGLADIQRSLLDKTQLLREISVLALSDPAPVPLQDRIRDLGEEIHTRVTVIGADGSVLADCEEDPAVMDNHGTRPEVLDARERGVGTATRFSRTLQQPMMYVALPIREGDRIIGYARTSLPLNQVDHHRAELRHSLILGGVVAAAVALVLGFVFARRVTRPLRAMTAVARKIAGGETRQRVHIGGAGEVALLGDSFNAMADQLEQRLESLSQDRNKLLAVLASMVEGVVAVDREERVVHMNEVAGAILDADPDGSLGKPIWEVCRATEICQAIGETMAEARGRNREFRSSGPGRAQAIELHAAPLRDRTGESSGAVVVLHDVTELRRLEAVRRDFVANVSHELKTPLTTIRGAVETVLDDPAMKEETRLRFLLKIKEHSHRLSALVGDFLTLSQVESPEREVERSRVDLRDILWASKEALDAEGEAKEITTEASLPEGAVHLQGDPEALRQMVDNLLSNAVRYTSPGGRIWLRLKREDSQAVLEVEDTGIGIEPRDQERVFERFYRVDKARSRELGGTGLGLSIVKHVAVAHGGEATVQSVPGKGSTFRVKLPLSGTP